jgi:hypothetical protein
MSKSFNHRNKQLNETLRRCKGGSHEEKSGRHRAKRSIQNAIARKEVKNHHHD